MLTQNTWKKAETLICRSQTRACALFMAMMLGAGVAACGNNSALVGNYACNNFWGFPEIQLKSNGTALFIGVTQTFAGSFRAEGDLVTLSWATISVPMRVENGTLHSIGREKMTCSKT